MTRDEKGETMKKPSKLLQKWQNDLRIGSFGWRALKSYFRRGYTDQPGEVVVINGYVILSNVRGELARFRILPSGRLKFVESPNTGKR